MERQASNRSLENLSPQNYGEHSKTNTVNQNDISVDKVGNTGPERTSQQKQQAETTDPAWNR